MEKRAQADELQQSVLALVDSSVSYGLSLATAVGILIAGYIISKWASRAIRRRLEAVDRFDRTLIPIVAQIARYAILIFTGILVLAEFGIQTTSIIAVLGAAGLAIGLALQGTLQNVAAGLMLLMIRPFRVGDYVDVADSSGTVDEIGLFMTRLHTPQSIFIAIPNSKIWSNTITNYSMRPNRRLDLTIGISYDDDIDTAVALLLELVKKDDRVLPDPEPRVIVKALGESSVDLQIRVWARRQDFWDVHFKLVRDAKYALDEAGISIPYPHRQVIMSEAAPAA